MGVSETDSQESVPDSQSQNTIEENVALFSEISLWLESHLSNNSDEIKAMMEKIDGYVWKLLFLLFPLNSKNISTHFLQTEILKRLVEKKKCLLDQQTLDASNLAVWGQLSDSGFDDIMVTSDVSHESGTVDVSTLDLSTVLRILDYQSLNEQQIEVLNACETPQDIVVIMPTGGGKSGCFIVPGLVKTGVTLIVSPLISLIEDQTNFLKSRGISVSSVLLSDSQLIAEHTASQLRHEQPLVKFIYVTPETLVKILKSETGEAKELLMLFYRNGYLLRIVVDESHCIPMWGNDFRLAYKELSILKQQFPTVPVMALTGTAPASVKSDIISTLGLINPFLSIRNCVRSNLNLLIENKVSKIATTKEILRYLQVEFLDQCGIVYCGSKTKCDDLAKHLSDNGITSATYYSDLSPKSKSINYTKWITGEVKVMCATSAFGMGIDKSNVRFVIHEGLPYSLMDYYQEVGRAGRDGEPATCILFYAYQDHYHMRYNNEILNDKLNRDQKLAKKKLLYALLDFCENWNVCRNFLIATYLEFTPQPCSSDYNVKCDICRKHITVYKRNVIDVVQKLVATVKSTRVPLTISKLCKVLQQSKEQQYLVWQESPAYGAASNWQAEEIVRCLRSLVLKNVLSEQMRKVDEGKPYGVLGIGTKYNVQSFEFEFRVLPKRVAESTTEPEFSKRRRF